MNFHVGEVVTSLQKATLIPGGSESLVYTTLSGGIGMLVPFTSHEVSQALVSHTVTWLDRRAAKTSGPKPLYLVKPLAC